MKRLDGKVVLFAGLGPIFGRAAAILFAQEGARIALAARSSDEVGRVADYLRGQGMAVLANHWHLLVVLIGTPIEPRIHASLNSH